MSRIVDKNADHVTEYGRSERGAVTPAGDLAMVFEAEARKSPEITWPSPLWAERGPVRFAFEVLGVKKLSPDQIRVLDAIHKHQNVSVASGHKVGKSLALAIAALWFWCSFPQANVLLAAVTEKQIERVIWKEIRILYRQARRLGKDLGGVFHKSAHNGLIAIDEDGTERTLFGVVANSAEGAAGLSGGNVFLIFDEASGIKESFFEALGTSLATGGSTGTTVKKCYISNPTKTTGEFARSHNSSTSEFHCLTISSEDTPNARGDIDNEIPGLAGPAWIAERRRVWGADSAIYKIRVLGQFVKGEDGKIFTELLLEAAEARWKNPALEPGGLETLAEWGRLFIGVDPAGPAQGGDESGFAVRRGYQAMRVYARRGLTADAHLTEIRGLCKQYRGPDELPPVVVVDRDGSVGAEVFGTIKAYAEANPHEFVLVGFRGSDDAWMAPDLYSIARDELWANGAKWMQKGAIPRDAQLKEDVHWFEWTSDIDGRLLKVTPKKLFRKELLRSPDRGDALLLSLWEPRYLAKLEARRAAPPTAESMARGQIDPYGGTAVQERPAMNPYGGKRSGFSPYAGGGNKRRR